MGNYEFNFSDETLRAVQEGFGREAWEKLAKYSEPELKSGLPTIGGFIQKRIKEGKMPGIVWALIDPKTHSAEAAAKNLHRLAHLQPCLVRIDGDPGLYESTDGTVVMGLQVGKHWILSSVFRESPDLPRDVKPKTHAVPHLDEDVWMAAAPAPARPGGKKRDETSQTLEDMFARVEAKLESGQEVVGAPQDEVFHFTLLMVDAFIEKLGLQQSVRKSGIDIHGKPFSVIFDKDIVNFFSDEPMEENMGSGAVMEIQTIYGSTDIAVRKSGHDLFQLTKITRLDLGHYQFLDLKPANPAYTKRVEEADVGYILSLKK